MSKKLTSIKKSFNRLKAITKNLSELEKSHIKASVKYKNLRPKTKEKYLKIYQYYVKQEKSEVETAQHFGVDISTVRNVINLFGQQLVMFAKDKNIIVPKLDEIRNRKNKLQKDIDKLNFNTEMSPKDGAVANIRIRYLAEWRKLEELELKLRSLLTPDSQINIDKSPKTINFVTNFEKPKPNVPENIKEKIIRDTQYEELPDE